ncbi:uncharacterized protein LOC114356155 [Ostrinia furnacalis]|uniref:uncharacterized protein LOC114356155 n=1 Tax=Ostrinia furnacalis TaxID=93504 RepID=UPI00103E658F|nr:uncharacterized protein LOC114356155 [Ostrinia furnacalis]
MSFESGESGNSYTPQDQHLQYFPEKETRSYRRFVPASWHETLSYYRGYVTAASKTQIYSPQYYPFNIFFWQNLMNLLFKSLPLTYVYMFLASYSANHHFFLPKMIPIAYVLSHLMLRDLFVKLEDDNSSQEVDPTTKLKSDLMWHNDLNMIALSMATPPIVHILTSRTNKEINANRDSSILLISNGIYSILKGLLSHKVKKYSQSILKETIDMEIQFFKIWTVYFSTFFLGDLFSITFFGIHFIVETLNVVITSQCLIEAIVCEWRVSRIGFYVYTQHVVTLLEIFVIFFMYPLGRLINDITFYTGVIPTQMRLYNLKGVPLYFAWKLYILLKFNTNWMKYIENDDNVYPDHLDYYFDVSIGIFLFIGILYAAVKNLYFYKKTWRSLLVPESNWGPEYSIRQLRKQYDSREYIGSQAPRPLSRYMIYKAEAKKYSLNIKYPSVTSDASSEVRYENEKKNV